MYVYTRKNKLKLKVFKLDKYFKIISALSEIDQSIKVNI